MSVTKASLVFVACAFSVNLLTWAVAGRASAFSEAAAFFEQSCPLYEIDTLHVFASIPSDKPGYATAGDLSQRQRARFLDVLSEVGKSAVAYHPVAGDVWPGSDEEVNFSVWVDRRIPLFAHVVAMEAASGYAADYSQHYVWALGWRPVGETRFGCS